MSFELETCTKGGRDADVEFKRRRRTNARMTSMLTTTARGTAQNAG
jgi:hypothetical protein